MKNARAINVLSAIFNVAILGGVIYAVVAFLLKDLVGNLVYFTVLSNLLVALAALICLPFNIVGIAKKKLLPKGVYIFKLIATACVGVTFVVATALLPILSGSTIPELYGNFDFQDVRFFMHLLIPVAAMLGFIFFDHTERAKFPVTLLALIPVALYSGFYVLNYFLHFKSVIDQGAETYDWYHFVDDDPSKLGLAIGMMAGIIVGAFVLAAILFLLNRLLNKGFFKQQEAQPEPVKVVTPEEEPEAQPEEQQEAQPAEEEPAPEEEPEPEAEPEEEPEKEEEPVEEPSEEPEKEEEPEEKPAVERKPVMTARRATPAKKEEPVKKATPAKKAEPAKKEEKPAPVKKAEPAKKEEAPAKAAPVKKAEPAKKEEKPAPAKKAEPAKKPAPAKKAEAAPAKAADTGSTKVYHLTKRKEDGMWAITFVGGQKAVKLFKTKKEAEAALKVLTENQGATALIRNSKGAKAGKFASSIKTDDSKK